MKKNSRTVFNRFILTMSLLISGLSIHGNEMYDSLEISLLTCDPHDEIYSLYGHTAIRLQDPSQGFDMVVNYGLFDSSAPNFVLRFIFGLTDYSMGFASFEMFKQEYTYYGSQVTQQKLNLTEADKASIMEAIGVNARPENVVYRYNYFYDNCTTRARDILVNHISGKVRYLAQADSSLTFRQLVHRCTKDHPWAQFGNDMLLGLQADSPIGQAEQQFLPGNLMQDFAHAQILHSDGSASPLVSKESIVVEPRTVPSKDSGFPLRPHTCALILLAVTIAVTMWELYAKKICWGFDLALLITSGLAGILLFLMIFSEHPTVRLNLQLLLLNPLPLLFVYNVVRKLRHHQSHIWWRIWEILIILFFLGGFFQHYAEGMYVLALTLLARCVINGHFRKMATNTQTGKSIYQKSK